MYIHTRAFLIKKYIITTLMAHPIPAATDESLAVAAVSPHPNVSLPDDRSRFAAPTNTFCCSRSAYVCVYIHTALCLREAEIRGVRERKRSDSTADVYRKVVLCVRKECAFVGGTQGREREREVMV